MQLEYEQRLSLLVKELNRLQLEANIGNSEDESAYESAEGSEGEREGAFQLRYGPESETRSLPGGQPGGGGRAGARAGAAAGDEGSAGT
eukprot:1991167-Pyramimonas_sp.AAC.1